MKNTHPYHVHAGNWVREHRGIYRLVRFPRGRVFQTDCDLENMKMARNSPEREWEDFQIRASGQKLYFDYKITA